jgi:hypothetical protein
MIKLVTSCSNYVPKAHQLVTRPKIIFRGHFRSKP